MATRRLDQPPHHSADELELAREGKLRLRTRDIADVIVEMSTLAGPVSDVGTAALQDIRDDRA